MYRDEGYAEDTFEWDYPDVARNPDDTPVSYGLRERASDLVHDRRNKLVAAGAAALAIVGLGLARHFPQEGNDRREGTEQSEGGSGHASGEDEQVLASQALAFPFLGDEDESGTPADRAATVTLTGRRDPDSPGTFEYTLGKASAALVKTDGRLVLQTAEHVVDMFGVDKLTEAGAYINGIGTLDIDLKSIPKPDGDAHDDVVYIPLSEAQEEYLSLKADQRVIEPLLQHGSDLHVGSLFTFRNPETDKKIPMKYLGEVDGQGVFVPDGYEGDVLDDDRVTYYEVANLDYQLQGRVAEAPERICEGDSGAPLTEPGTDEVVGLVSGGFGYLGLAIDLTGRRCNLVVRVTLVP